MAEPNERERLSSAASDAFLDKCHEPYVFDSMGWDAVADLIISEREKARAEAFALAVVIARSRAHGQPKMDGSTVYRNPSALNIARDIEQAATHTEGRDV